jgi:hypothetical protein
MNKIDLIIDALELCSWHDQQGYLTVQKALAAARELRVAVGQAVLQEREACAKWLEELREHQTNQSLLDVTDCAEAIRARGNYERKD